MIDIRKEGYVNGGREDYANGLIKSCVQKCSAMQDLETCEGVLLFEQ